MNAELTECVTDTLYHANSASLSVRALIELLDGCAPDYKLSAHLFVGLIIGVQSHLENVMDGLRVVGGKPVEMLAQPAAAHGELH